MKPIIAWAICKPSGKIMPQYVQPDERIVKLAFQRAMSTRWDELERMGYRAVRVRITEEIKDEM